jgi:hypothetical protein
MDVPTLMFLLGVFASIGAVVNAVYTVFIRRDYARAEVADAQKSAEQQLTEVQVATLAKSVAALRSVAETAEVYDDLGLSEEERTEFAEAVFKSLRLVASAQESEGVAVAVRFEAERDGPAEAASE